MIKGYLSYYQKQLWLESLRSFLRQLLLSSRFCNTFKSKGEVSDHSLIYIYS